MESANDRQWFVAKVKPQHEATVAQGFDLRQLERFSPTYEIARQHKQASRRILRPPLFPGYVFCRFMRLEQPAVLKTPGVTSIISFGGNPVAVSEQEIARIRTIIASGVAIHPWPYLERGNSVLIDNGPLRGVEGIVVEADGDYSIVVSITLLQRSVSVRIEREMVSHVSNPVKKSPAGGYPAGYAFPAAPR
jgi:transcription antitermination factor NusG